MNVESIGTNAGLIWNALNESKSMNLKDLKKATKLKEKEAFLALGWLAREGKVSLEEAEKDVIITLL